MSAAKGESRERGARMLRLGYITNGFGDHSLEQAAEVLHHFGYQSIGITLGPPHLDPRATSRGRLEELRRTFERRGLEPVIETGARYVLDPFRKHRPSLVSVDSTAREQRASYYRHAIDIAAELGAPLISVWSGTPQPKVPEERSWSRLVAGLLPVLDHAAERGIRVAFEPEPGMFIEDLADWRALRERVDHPALGLTIDVGHLAVREEAPWERHLIVHRDELLHVHLDDAANGIHEHLPPGQGELDWTGILGALDRIGFGGVALVELSRHSHVAPVMAQRSILFLRRVEARVRAAAAAGGSPPRGAGDDQDRSDA